MPDGTFDSERETLTHGSQGLDGDSGKPGCAREPDDPPRRRGQSRGQPSLCVGLSPARHPDRSRPPRPSTLPRGFAESTRSRLSGCRASCASSPQRMCPRTSSSPAFRAACPIPGNNGMRPSIRSSRQIASATWANPWRWSPPRARPRPRRRWRGSRSTTNPCPASLTRWRL